MAESAAAVAEEPNKNPPPPKPTTTKAAIFPSNPLAFFAYLTILISLLAALLLPRSSDHRPSSYFLSLPDELRRHYAAGRLIKAHPSAAAAAASPIEIFVSDHDPRDTSETVLVIHGLGCSSYSFRTVLASLASAGLRAVALDLPGSGFSDPLPSEPERGAVSRVLKEIKEKGVFSAFDHLIETGQILYQESPSSGTKKSGYEPSEIGRVIGQVADSMGLSLVHLVLHDSALVAGANWVNSMNPGSVRSVTLIDAAAESAAFPSWILGAPVLGEIPFRSRAAFNGLVRLCCSRSVDGSSAEAHRILLRRSNGRNAVVEAGKALNYSFDVGEWAASEAMKDVPVQVLWSNTWSDRWIDEGRRVASAIPGVKFASHFGGRWPQEDAAEEISVAITKFVLSLPRTVRPISENEEYDIGHHHHHHGHEAGSTDMYGVSQRWGS